MYIVYFIQKCLLKGCPIEQFSSILGISSYVWKLLQAISKTSWDQFKILPQSNTPTLVEAIRTVYGPDSVPVPFPNVEIAVDVLVAKEVTFTLVTNQKCKNKGKASFSLSGTSPNSRSKTSLVSRALPFPKAVTTCLAITISKTIQA